MSQILIQVDKDATEARFSGYAPALYESISRNMDAFAIYEQSYIKREKLSAPEGFSATMLHRRSGDLSRSIHWRSADESASIVREVFSDKTVPYGPLHE